MLSQLLGLLFAVGAEGGIGGEAGGRGHGGVVGYCVGIDGPGHAHAMPDHVDGFQDHLVLRMRRHEHRKGRYEMV